MKVILTEKVPTLGNVGEIVNVSAGHARNYLLPRNLARLADEANKRAFEDQKRRLAKKIDAQKNDAVALKNKIDGLTLELTKKIGGSGKLFGTVTNTELAKELAGKGIEIERRIIHIDTPIKTLGQFDIKVKLFIIPFHTGASPDYLLKFRHGINHFVYDDIAAHLHVHSGGQQLAGSDYNGCGGFQLLKAAEMSAPQSALIRDYAANIVGILLYKVGIQVVKNKAHFFRFFLVFTKDYGFAKAVCAFKKIRKMPGYGFRTRPQG